MLVTKNGQELRDAFLQAGIMADVIGMTTKQKDRVVMVGEEERFLVPTKGDALNAVFYGQPIPV